MSVKVSVIVPVYNVKPYLERCINSIMNQTLSDIEIICVDDGSSDGSDQLLRQLAKGDDRIKTLFHKTNMSTLQARKDAVAISTGQYIMFLDSDDTYVADACEVAYNAIVEKNVDMLQFGTTIENCVNASAHRISMNERLLKPYTEEILYGDMVMQCWKEKTFRFTLWNKIYRGDLCREAYLLVEEGSFPKAQDLYAFFIIACLAKSYAGISTKLYCYSFGTGITGQSIIDLSHFGKILSEQKVAAAIRRFIDSRNLTKYNTIIDTIELDLAADCVNNWNEYLEKHSQLAGLELLIETWGYDLTVFALAKILWWRSDVVAKCFMDTPYLKSINKNKPIRTIAAHYRCIINGGAQRVVAALCNIWESMKDTDGNPLYKVILITEEADLGEESEYPLASAIERAYLPDRKTTVGDSFKTRYKAWNNILDRYDIDVIVNGMWLDPTAFWDMFAIRNHLSKPAYVLHTHSFNCVPYLLEGSNAYALTQIYKLVDGVVVLSECDREYVSTFADHVKYIVNPVFLSPDDVKPSVCMEPVIVWIGRISAEKQPLDAVKTMKYVVKTIPDAKLYLVGSGDKEIENEIHEYIDHHSLNDNVIMPGFTFEVEKYYQNAAVYISTSKHEGYSLTFMEAMTHGLPVVAYDMPWLSIAQDGRGLIFVESGNPVFMAEQIVKLLSDYDLCCSVGMEGRSQILDMQSIDIGKEWQSFFNSIYMFSSHKEAPSYKDILISKMSEYQQDSKDKLREKHAELLDKYHQVCNDKTERGIKIKILQEEIDALHHSFSFRIGQVITKPLRMLKCVLKRIIYFVRNKEDTDSYKGDFTNYDRSAKDK